MVLLPFIPDRQSGILSYLVESFSGARLFAEYKYQSRHPRDHDVQLDSL